MKHILICPNCKIYTMKGICQSCGGKAQSPKPPKFSPEDKFGAYRRKAKKQQNNLVF